MEESYTECVLCAEPMEQNVLLPCGHSPMCMKCYLTLQKCYKQNQCPICQHEITPGPIITHKSISTDYNEEVKKDLTFNEELKFYYSEDDIKQEMESYLKYQCPECGEYFTNKKQFQNHLRDHNLVICNSCSRSGRFLNIDTPIYNKAEIKIHNKQHPHCLVCPFIAFDAHELGVHMNDCHLRCNLCAKQDKILWFATLEDLLKHNREYHYICEHADCINQPNNAYNDSLELQFHQLAVHKTKITSTVVPTKQMDFQHETDQQLRREANQRHMEACKRLALKANQEFHGNKRRVGSLLTNIDNLDNRSISPEDFMKSYHKICGKLAEVLFCDTMSAVGDPDMRAVLMRLMGGYRTGTEVVIERPEDNPEQDFPTLGSVYEVPEKKETPKPAPKKNIKIKGKTWDKIKLDQPQDAPKRGRYSRGRGRGRF